MNNQDFNQAQQQQQPNMMQQTYKRSYQDTMTAKQISQLLK